MGKAVKSSVKSSKVIATIATAVIVLLLFFSAVGESKLIAASSESGAAPLTVSFSITNIEDGSSVNWDFDSDGIVDSAEKSSTWTFSKEGEYVVAASVTNPDSTQEIFTKIIAVAPALSASIAANPSSGIAPLLVQFTAVASGKEPLFYAWDFDGDGITDSTEQKPSATFEVPGENVASLTIADGAGNKVTKTISVTVKSYDSKVKLVSFFPSSINLKENQITFLVSNEGKETVRDLSAKVIGDGIQHLSSTTISRLKPGEQDSMTAKINVLRSGALSAVVKIDEKAFSIDFTVAEQKEYSRNDLEAKLNDLRQSVQEQEDIYYDKKAQNYLVSELFDGIKSVKKGLQDAQQQLLKGNLEGAAVALDLASSEIDDVSRNLQESQKQKQTILAWLKENAIALTTIIAALGTVSGFIVKASLKAKKLGEDVTEKAKKLSADVKEKIIKKQNLNLHSGNIEENTITENNTIKEDMKEKNNLP